MQLAQKERKKEREVKHEAKEGIRGSQTHKKSCRWSHPIAALPATEASLLHRAPLLGGTVLAKEKYVRIGAGVGTSA